MAIIENFESAPAGAGRQLNLDPVALLKEYSHCLKGTPQDTVNALQGKLYPDKNDGTAVACKTGLDAAAPPGAIKDMSGVDESKIAKTDIKQQAEWLLWKASDTNPGKNGRLLIPIPKNFADDIVDKIATSGTLRKQFEDEGYGKIRKTTDDRGHRLLSVTRN
jgi:hypothetical protein